MFDRYALQTLTTKLDLGAITLKDAKDFVRKNYSIVPEGRTKESFLRALARSLTPGV